MTEKMKEQAAILLQKYNTFLEEGYVSYMTSAGVYQDEQVLLDGMRDTLMEKWEQNPIKELEGKTPLEFIGEIQDLKDLMELFVYISANTFDSTPRCLIQRLSEYGEEAALLLADQIDLRTAEAYDLNSNEIPKEANEALEITLSAIQALAVPGFGGEAVIRKLIALIQTCNPANTLFLEQAAVTLAKRAEESSALVIEAIQRAEVIGEKEEHLLSAICDIAESAKNDAIYQCLKQSFLRMPNHMLGAVFLGDYGDGRAIPAMRRFAKENLGKITMDEYYTILAGIEKLGGLIEDLLPQNPLR